MTQFRMRWDGWYLVKCAAFVITVPWSILCLLCSTAIHPAYRMTWRRKFALGLRMFWNTLWIPTASSWKVHLAMALKLLELSPDVPGVVVECGTWKGGSAANLSLVCRLTGRRLLVFDSFEGLPAGTPGDREAVHYHRGDYCGSLDEVRRTVAHYGALECCEFIPGWFEKTLPTLQAPVVLAWLDVDLERSLETCVRWIWPRLSEPGFLFIDECVNLTYASLFWSERWWQTHFHRPPPGLVGTGTGVALGDYYLGPLEARAQHPLQHPGSGAWTTKSMTAWWFSELP